MQRLTSALIVTVALSVFAASPASAQTREAFYNLTGFSVGGHIGTGFNTPEFEVDEQGPATYNTQNFLNGPVSGGINFGGQVTYQRAVWQKIVAGGEFAFGKLGYSGEVRNGPGNDTLQETRGGTYWSALGRVGYAVNERAMPYFSIGFLGATNNVRVLDDCIASPCGPLMVDASASGMADKLVWGFGFQYELGMRAMNKTWSLNVDYMNADFRTNVIAQDASNHSWRFNTHIPQGIIRASINVHLGK